MTSLRTFIAIPLPAELKAILAAAGRALDSQLPSDSVRWVRPEQMHLTLIFLGDTPLAQLPAVQQAMDRAAGDQARFHLSLGNPGCFPNCRRPRVLWLGLSAGAAACQALKAGLDAQLASLGWAPEKRPFTPHLTLGRARRNGKLPPLDLAAITTTPFRWPVNEIRLYESELRPAGPRYTVRHSAGLAA